MEFWLTFLGFGVPRSNTYSTSSTNSYFVYVYNKDKNILDYRDPHTINPEHLIIDFENLIPGYCPPSKENQLQFQLENYNKYMKWLKKVNPNKYNEVSNTIGILINKN